MGEGPSRRHVLGTGVAAVVGGLAGACASAGGAGAPVGSGSGDVAPRAAGSLPVTAPHDRVVASTWKFGVRANAVAWESLAGGGSPLDACEAGVALIEADATVGSVGLGGRPNAEGIVQLDACIMDGETLACGGVAALEGTLHPVSVARAVMERTPHVLLAGDGARTFARGQGFPEQDLLTDASRVAWEEWLEKRHRPPADEDHDTIGMIVYDRGRFAMAVTTSGIAYKLPGRVGDSPIIGAGGYCDDRAGACVATGEGEEMIRTCSSFAVVEALRRGVPVAEACAEIAARVAENMARGDRSGQVALVAVDTAGRVASAARAGGFQYAVTSAAGTELIDGAVGG